VFEGLEQILKRLDGYSAWKVTVQLVLVWIVVFTIFQFLRGTRGARALKGLFLVLVLVTIAVGAVGADSDFAPLRWLLERFLGFMALAMVIVFHPEIRRALVRLGEARFFRAGMAEVESIVEEVVAAAEYLSKHKIGAIIAIERSVGLEGIIQAGTRIDGQLSADLLKSIFWPGTALHDMGVVIRGDRVLAAGVQFPLAEGDDLSQELGSRHRAAVGLSQEADCLVLVISEETGAISLAERGHLCVACRWTACGRCCAGGSARPTRRPRRTRPSPRSTVKAAPSRRRPGESLF
jgi:diadenylate cyclase